jgi:hypothetical protein
LVDPEVVVAVSQPVLPAGQEAAVAGNWSAAPVGRWRVRRLVVAVVRRPSTASVVTPALAVRRGRRQRPQLTVAAAAEAAAGREECLVVLAPTATF